MDKRYQVFVSSTYADLQDERQEVMQALLELDCIPAGMELFPAANEDQWSLIKKVIDDCDYYIVIIAGRYGSVGPDGRSFTEMEYRYAIERKKPVIGFLHRQPESLPANQCEQTVDGKERLQEFCKHVRQKMCRFWDSPADLGSQVSRSLVKLIKSHPGIGWVRADLVPDSSTAEEILRLRNRIDELQVRLAAARFEAPEGATALAQGDDRYKIRFQFQSSPVGKFYESTSWTASTSVTWDHLFAAISPLMIDEATESAIQESVNRLIAAVAPAELRGMEALKNVTLKAFSIDQEDFQTIKIQLRALGLITKSTKSRSVKDTSTYWTLTPYGDTVMTRLLAIPRDSIDDAADVDSEGLAE